VTPPAKGKDTWKHQERSGAKKKKQEKPVELRKKKKASRITHGGTTLCRAKARELENGSRVSRTKGFPEKRGQGERKKKKTSKRFLYRRDLLNCNLQSKGKNTSPLEKVTGSGQTAVRRWYRQRDFLGCKKNHKKR